MHADYPNILRNRKLKATPARLALLETINTFKGAIPYSQLQLSLKNIDRVTLYRNIKSLIDKGIIHKAHHQNNEDYYAMCSSSCSVEQHNHQHIHFKCDNCQVISCIHTEHPVQFNIPGVKINNIDITASGICDNCQ